MFRLLILSGGLNPFFPTLQPIFLFNMATFYLMVRMIFPILFIYSIKLLLASTNRRTMVATILPKNICVGNSIIITKIFNSVNGKRLIEERDLFFLCGIFNSFLFDYLLRLKVTTNINMFYIYEMPIPRLKRNSREYEEIVKNVFYLFSHYSEFESIKKEINNSFFNSKKQNTTQIRAKVDAIVAKLYDLDLIELEYVLDQFHQRDLNKEKQLSVLKDNILIQFKKITTS